METEAARGGGKGSSSQKGQAELLGVQARST